ncbi:hypothetical protein H0H81_000235 [Sphagnurus paluster]|uniref:Cytochrome P450 n=1 Tax=Sphagnurus paluster TaxID=117069 RepID=A0A9P7GNU0_9AGAR|nr:hypothetical protein H0H81_000235 [Sphagnurus paluster]
MLHTNLNKGAVEEIWDLLEDQVATLLDGLSKSPEKYEYHIRRNAAAAIMKMAYGYTLTEDDFFIKLAEEASQISGLATAPGKWLVDYYPLLRFVPSFFPGAGWKRQGEAWRERLNALSGVPHAWVKAQMALSGDSFTESFTSRHLRASKVDMLDSEKEDIVKWCAGGLYAGAGDTTVSALLSFIMLMALHPGVQTKIREELDSVVGHGNAPRASEVDKLVYLNSVLKEVLRYAPVANLGKLDSS